MGYNRVKCIIGVKWHFKKYLSEVKMERMHTKMLKVFGWNSWLFYI